MTEASKKKVALHLALLIPVWGLSWPISKIGLKFMNPVSYATWRFGIALVCLLLFLGVKRKIHAPRREDFLFIGVIGLFQMAVFVLLLNMGLLFVGAGKAAMIVYSTPIWVTPVSFYFFKERVTAKKAIGLSFAMLGLLFLIDPFSLAIEGGQRIFGYLMLISASLVWAGVILYARYRRWQGEPMDLLLWQVLMAAMVLVVFNHFYDSAQPTVWSVELVVTLAFNGVVATAYAYFASILVAKNLPATVTSVSFLGVPIVGLVSSLVLLHEPITMTLALGIFCAIVGMVLLTARFNQI